MRKMCCSLALVFFGFSSMASAMPNLNCGGRSSSGNSYAYKVDPGAHRIGMSVVWKDQINGGGGNEFFSFDFCNENIQIRNGVIADMYCEKKSPSQDIITVSSAQNNGRKIWTLSHYRYTISGIPVTGAWIFYNLPCSVKN